MKHLLHVYLSATMLFFATTYTQNESEEVNIHPEDITEFFIEHQHEIPCVKIVFSVLVENEEIYNKANWEDLITIAHNATELLETTANPSSIALLTPIFYLLEKYKAQDDEALQAGINIDILNVDLLDEVEASSAQIIHLPGTPSSVQHTFLENPMCVAFAFTIEKSELTTSQDWATILEHTGSFIMHVYEKDAIADVIDALSEFLFTLEDAQKENSTLSTKIEIVA